MDREKRDLIVSWLTVSFAFAWAGPQIFFSSRIFGDFLFNFFVVLIAVGFGFILHELAHKYVSLHYGVHAEFRAWNFGLVLAVLFAFLTNGVFTFAAPGAVYILGEVSRKQNGIISLAGPLTNIVIGLAFSAVAFLFAGSIVSEIAGYVAYINFFLAAFNLLPIPPLDGSKVINWNALVWAVFFIPLALFIFLPGFFGF